MYSAFVYRILLLAIVLLPTVIHADIAIAQKRIALVIGNSNYTQSNPLPNPVNDANLMAKTLEDAGFEVTKLLDADLRTMRKAVLKFGRALRKKTEAGLFYYAGHGIQVGGENFLIPVNASIADEDEIELEGIKLNSFLRVMRSSSASVNIVVLDACRNNPFARSFRSAGRGLAPVDAPKGTYIAYATAPGDVAADGDGDNSPYTKALAKAMSVRGIAIETVFKQARKSVLDETNNSQVPWETTSITGDFYFHKPAPVQAPISTINPTNDAEKFYGMIKDTNSIEILKTFAERFPRSFYAKLANARIGEITQKQVALEAAKRKAINNPGETNRFAKLKKADAGWKLLNSGKDIKALKKFAEDYSDTAFAALANGRIEQLSTKKDSSDIIAADRVATVQAARSALDSEAEKQWSTLSQSKSIPALQIFASKFSSTTYAAFANKRIVVLKPKNNKNSIGTLASQAETQWKYLRDSKSIPALQVFASKFSSTSFAVFANLRIADLQSNYKKQNSIASLESQAKKQWETLYKSRSIPALQIFASKFATTSYAAIAQSRIFSLKSENKPTRTIKKVGSTKQVKLATIGKWHSFHYDTNGGKSCYTATRPTNGNTNAARTLFISNWLKRGQDDVVHEPSINFAKNRLPVSKITLEIDGIVYNFRVNEGYAYPMSKFEHTKIIAAMKAKRQVFVRTTAKNGKTYVDRFSLNGVTASIKRIDRACPTN